MLIERTAVGWETVFRGGVSGNGLRGAAVTEDGERLWMVGNSGTIGEYDVTTENLVDRSQPDDASDQFNSVAVTGPAGDTDAYVVDAGSVAVGGSGTVVKREDGDWNVVDTPSG